MGGGGGGEEMEVEVRLSTGALEAMWREHELRPVLQLADEPRMDGRYRVALSDGGVRLHPGMLSASLNQLVSSGALRRGTVIRVLEYFAGVIGNQRVIIVIQLEILHAGCTPICSPTTFEANATQHIGVSCSSGPAIHEPCSMPCTQQVISNSSCSPDKEVLDSSVTPSAEPTVVNLPFNECFCSMPAHSTVDAQMQQLPLNDHQNQKFTVTATGLSDAMAVQLTPDAVVAIFEHADGNRTLQPMLQVVDVQIVNNVKNPSTERFRMVLSDSVYTMQSMLTTAVSTRVQDGSIQKGSIIHLLEFTCSTIQNRRTILIFGLEILQSKCTLIGSLKFYEPTRNSGVSSTSRSISYGPCFGVIRMGSSCEFYPSRGDKLSSVALWEKPPVWKLVGQIKDDNLGCDIFEPCTYGCSPCKYECSVRIEIQDHTGTASASAYEETAEEILACRAKDLYSLKYKEHDHAQLDDIIRRAVGKQYVLQLKVEGPRLSGVKYIVLNAEKVNPSAESHRLLGQIDTHLQEGSVPGLEFHS